MKKRMSRILLVLSMLVLSAYITAAQCLDQDGDLYGIGCEKGGDCNDNDPFVNPGMSEYCGNGVDDNCDGTVDEGSCCADFDRDGYGNPGSTECSKPETDCNNNNNAINPGVSESIFDLCLDGLDNNCNGLIDKDDQACSEFYPPGGEELTEQGASASTTSSGISNIGGGGSSLCAISAAAWSDIEGNIITEAPPGADISLILFGEDCVDLEATFEIRQVGGTGPIESARATFKSYPEAEAAVYSTQAPTEEGIYTFTATTDAETLTSSQLIVRAGGEPQCEIQWDCSLIDYGECSNGIKTRKICPGYEGTAQCCADEASCACTPITPTDICTSYTYASVEAEKSCITKGTPKSKEPRREQGTEGEPRSLLIPFIIGGGIVLLAIIAIVFFMLRKPAVKVPDSLVNYVKAARDKKAPDSAIKAALEKSGWKPDQIKAAFKKAK